ncbi:hypothetical protein BCR33DRAFT_94283 [Rhizoclosmatium globosum]|uniref:Uncharacterized protein n=1 Tax=Rhizoclosmatium globosum TaxID=329046 RepID=A0A1Y2CK00_9FUNG|nr:hypothetical protein BCR33DRAFT_94283 [Rhizoclosmatium globosum]|eukprot:ORY47330.1 hypothetical protein BCR33DRAFT_94283 [Rhizoclosmatium globosum]
MWCHGRGYGGVLGLNHNPSHSESSQTLNSRIRSTAIKVESYHLRRNHSNNINNESILAHPPT